MIPNAYKTIFSNFPQPERYSNNEWERLLLYYYDDRWSPQNQLESLSDLDAIQEDLKRLADGYPLAYVSGKSHFYGRVFDIEPGVLIPRPETEELVEWAVLGFPQGAEVLDVGCGSGCIALTLALERPDVSVSAIDVSESALQVARKNAKQFDLSLSIEKGDILDPSKELLERKWDCIISNPPYVRPSEGSESISHEPDLALFTPESDPLLFYRALRDYGEQSLKATGIMLLELSEYFATDIGDLFSSDEWSNCEIKSDMQGKSRMLRAIKK